MLIRNLKLNAIAAFNIHQLFSNFLKSNYIKVKKKKKKKYFINIINLNLNFIVEFIINILFSIFLKKN